MPTDFQAVVYSAVWNCIQTGVTSYNADILAGLLPGCKAVAPNQLFDDRPANGALPGRTVEKIANRAPADFPQIRVQITGDSEPATPTPTFGLQQGNPAADAITPITITLKRTITWDTVLDSAQTPLSAYIKAAFKAVGIYPNLGIPYCQKFTQNSRRGDKMINKIKRTVEETDIVVFLWPHLATTR